MWSRAGTSMMGQTVPQSDPTPAWTAEDSARAIPPGIPSRRTQPTLLTIVVVLLVIGGVGAVLLYSTSCGTGCHPPQKFLTSAITMSATTAGTCAAVEPTGFTASTYNISIGGVTSAITTSNFDLSLTEPGTGFSVSPGLSVASTGSACPGGATAYVPSQGSWDVVLLSPGGTSALAEFMKCGTNPNPSANQTGWFTPSCGPLPSPAAISGGETLVVVANEVSLAQAQLAVYGLNGAYVSGSVTL